jgi:hypothetical protein
LWDLVFLCFGGKYWNKAWSQFRSFIKKFLMEKIINIHIEKLKEGFFLATSENIQGLVAQGRTITETL